MFALQNRLRKTTDFTRVFKNGKSAQNGGILVKVRPNNEGRPRIGIIVSKKFSKKAVERNRLRRILAEAIRAYPHIQERQQDIVFVALPHCEARTKDQAQEIISKLLKQ
jgi:ribonuclease P protein component